MTTATPATRTLWGQVTEDALLDSVLQAAALGGWAAFHVRNSKAGIIQGPAGEGFPDLVLCNGRRILYRELKSQRGHLTAAQEGWRDRLTAAGADWGLWRPSDWHAIESALMGRR